MVMLELKSGCLKQKQHPPPNPLLLPFPGMEMPAWVPSSITTPFPFQLWWVLLPAPGVVPALLPLKQSHAFLGLKVIDFLLEKTLFPPPTLPQPVLLSFLSHSAPIWLCLTLQGSHACCFQSELWHLAGGREEQGKSNTARYSAQQYCSQSPLGMYVHASVLLEDRFDSRPRSTDKLPTHRPLPGPLRATSPFACPLPPPYPKLFCELLHQLQNSVLDFHTQKARRSWGGSDACFWLVVEGGGGWDAVHASVQPFSSSLPQGTVLLGATSPRGARTGLHHCPIRLGSWVSSQLIQKTPGTCALSHAQPCCPLHMRLHHCRCRGTLLVAEIVSEPEIQTQERQHRVPFVSAEGKCQQADANLPSHCTACNLQPHPCGAGTAAGLLTTSIPRTESSTHSPAICRQQLTACSTHVQKNITNQAFCNKPGFLQQA